MKRETVQTRRMPPKDTRFRPGQSGNLKGRPKGSVSFQTLIERELRKSVVINEHGRQKRFTKQEIIVRRLAHDGINGDYKAIALLMKLANIASISDSDLPDTNVVIPNKSMLKLIAKRLDQKIKDNDHE